MPANKRAISVEGVCCVSHVASQSIAAGTSRLCSLDLVPDSVSFFLSGRTARRKSNRSLHRFQHIGKTAIGKTYDGTR